MLVAFQSSKDDIEAPNVCLRHTTYRVRAHMILCFYDKEGID